MAKEPMNIKNHVLKSQREYMTEDYKTRNKVRQHRGIDMVALSDKGNCVTDYVVAIEEGTVAIIGKNSSIGNYIYIKHPCGLYSVYYHLRDNSIEVKKGQKVEKGQVLAYMGNTGVSTGAHVHVGILTTTSGTSDIDPLPYLKGEKSLLAQEWKPGTYRFLVSKTIRTSCSLTPLNRVRVKECAPKVKPLLTSTKPNDIAMFKVGVEYQITEIIKKGDLLWGKLKTDYVVVRNADGTPQVEFIK